MSEPLPFDVIKMWQGYPDLYMNWLEEILKTIDDSDNGNSIEVDLRYPDNIKEKPKKFPIAPEKEIIHKDKFNDYMKKIKPKNFTKAKKLPSDWSDKKNYLVHYRMLKIYVRHGMILDKTHEINSYKQTKWLAKYLNSNTQK